MKSQLAALIEEERSQMYAALQFDKRYSIPALEECGKQALADQQRRRIRRIEEIQSKTAALMIEIEKQ